MGRSDTPVKIVLTASISLVASSALQGTTAIASVTPEQQWKAVQQSIEREAGFHFSAGSGGHVREAQTTPPPIPPSPYGPGPLGPYHPGTPPTNPKAPKSLDRPSLRVTPPPIPTPVGNRPPIHVSTPPLPKIK